MSLNTRDSKHTHCNLANLVEWHQIALAIVRLILAAALLIFVSPLVQAIT